MPTRVVQIRRQTVVRRGGGWLTAAAAAPADALAWLRRPALAPEQPAEAAPPVPRASFSPQPAYTETLAWARRRPAADLAAEEPRRPPAFVPPAPPAAVETLAWARRLSMPDAAADEPTRRPPSGWLFSIMPGPPPSVAVFRRTLSAHGTRIGDRQVHLEG